MLTTVVASIEIGSGGLSVAADGSVFLADFGMILGDNATMGRKVVRWSPDEGVRDFASGFAGASGNDFDSSGVLYQANIRGDSISRISPDGAVVEFVSDGIRSPVGIVIDESDIVYVANCGHNTIQRVGQDGSSEEFSADSLLNGPNGLALGPNNDLYVANFEDGKVLHLAADGQASVLAVLPGGNNGHLTFHDGYLYVVARSAHQLFRVSLDGDVQLFAGNGTKGQTDGPRLEASFCYPNDVEVSPDGQWLYVNDVADISSDGTKLGPTALRRVALS